MSNNAILDGSKSTLYMTVSKMLPSAQGMTIWIDRMFMFYDTGASAKQRFYYDLLTPADILDQFLLDSDALFTQGGTLYSNRIYYTFGLPRKA